MISHERFASAMVFYSQTIPKWAPNFKNPQVIATWYSFFKQIDEHQLAGAFRKIMSVDTEFPSIAKLKRVLETGMNLDESQMGEDIAGRIESALHRYGSARNTDRVRDHVGELGWQVVAQVGGWNRICEITYDQLPSSRRQWRELGAVLARKAQMGCLDTPPGLNAPESKFESLVGDSLKDLKNVVSIGPTNKKTV